MQTPAPLVCQSSGRLSGSPPFAEIHLYSIAFLYPTGGFLFLSPTGNLLPVVAITIYVSDSPLFPVAGKVGKRAVFDIRRKGNPKTIGFWRKLPKRRLWQIQQGGFEEVSRFSRHNVTGNRLTRRCVPLPTFPAGGKSGPSEARSLQKKSTRRNEKENLQRGNGFPRPACGLVSE